MKFLLSFGVVVFLLTAASGNVVFNSGFELGLDGYELNWLSNPFKNPKLLFPSPRIAYENPAAGKQYLRIDNPFGEVFELHSREFRLEAGKSYTASLMARGEAPDSSLELTVYGMMPDQRWFGYKKTFQLTTEWQEYSFSFVPQGSGYYHFMILPGDRHAEVIPPCYIDLDELRLDNGTPPATLEVAVASSSDLYERGRDENALLTLKLRNCSAVPVSSLLKLRGVDVYFNRVLWEKTIAVDLTPGEMRAIPFKQPLTACGGVRVEIENMPEAFAGYYVVIDPYEVRPVDIRREFCVGINGAINHEERRSAYPGFFARGKSIDDNLDQLARIGVRLIRERDGGAGMAQWRYLQPQEGIFDFTHADFLLSLYRKHQLEPLPILSDDFIEGGGLDRPGWQNRGHLPGWILKKSTRVQDDPPNVMRSAHGHIMLPPQELYRRYVRAFAEHYRGRVQAVELMNEPNLWIAPESYMNYLRIASAELRAAAPEMFIVGLCPTGDKESETAMPWTQLCVRDGVLSMVDAVSFHPYNSRELGSSLSADTYLDALKLILASHPLPVWNTELYYCYDLDSEDKRDPQSCSADQAVRRFLTDLGEGCGQSISLHSFAIGLWYSKITPHFNNAEGSLGLHPSPVLVAYNALARYFEGAKPIGKFRFPRQIICYSFRDRAGKPLAAVWNYGEAKGVVMDFAGMEVRDIFGNLIDAAKPLEVTRVPYFLFPGILSEQVFQTRLENLKPIVLTPVSVSSVARLSGETVRIGIHNDGDAQVSTVVGFRGEGWATVRPERVELAPGSFRTLELPVHGNEGDEQPAEVMLNLNRHIFRQPVKLYRNTEWRSGEEIQLQSPDGVLRGSARISLDADKLVMTFKVADKTDAGVKGERYFWESDSIELFLDRDPEEFFPNGENNRPERYQSGTFRIFLMPRDPRGEQIFVTGDVLRQEDVAVSVTADSAGYFVRVELPADKVLTSSKRMGLDIKINDAAVPHGKTVRSASFTRSTVPHLERFVFNIIDFNRK